MVEEFAADTLKTSTTISEVILLGPSLDREHHRKLLNLLIAEFENAQLLDLVLLQGLMEMVRCASPDYLLADDLVRILAVLRERLQATHQQDPKHPYQLVLALACLLDVMVEGKVQDLSRVVNHEPLTESLKSLYGSDDPYLMHQARYSHQALLHIPNDESRRQFALRHAGSIVGGILGIASVCSLNFSALSQGSEKAIDFAKDLLKVGGEVVEGFQSVSESGESIWESVKGGVLSGGRLLWYMALREAQEHILHGRLSDFNKAVFEAPCRRETEFQWGICMLLGEIAIDPLWDSKTRIRAVNFLVQMYKNEADPPRKQNDELDLWTLNLLRQVSIVPDAAISEHAQLSLTGIGKEGDSKKQALYRQCMDAPSNPHLIQSHLSPLSSSPLLTKVLAIPTVEYDLHNLRRLRITDYTEPVYIAPMAKSGLQAPDDKLFFLMESVKEFMASDRQVMLILGDSGAGKSTFKRHLENELWKEYQTGSPIPLFISLPALDRPDKELVMEHLVSCNFTEDQARELKLQRELVLICDGYDESQLQSNLHTTNALGQSGYRKVKLIVSCRSQYLGSDYEDRFAPVATGKYYGTAKHLFQEAVIAPFSNSQIEQYVEKYAPLEPRTWVKKDYMDRLIAIPQLMDLVKNPFLLALALEAFPLMVEGRTDPSTIRVTRVELYDTFVLHWLSVNKRRLQRQKLREASSDALEALLADGFEQNGILFQKELATAIFKEQDGRPVVDYSQIRDRQTWKARFFGNDPECALLRDSSLLGRNGKQYRFVHRSVLECFFSSTIWDPSSNDDESTPHVFFDPTGTPLSIADHPLSQRDLLAEPSIIQFLAERVNGSSTSGFKAHLLALIELSKSDPTASRAAANAITILVRACVRFNGADLRGVRIPGADLSGGQFDSVQLQEADLTGVNFSKAWIRQVDFSNAFMEGTQFGELPYLESGDAWACAFSPDGQYLAVGLQNGDINIYDTVFWTKTLTFQGHSTPASSLDYSPTGDRIVSGSSDKTVRLWDCKTGSCVFVLNGHSAWLRDVAFSPSGKEIASACDDETVRIWDTDDGSVLHVLTGHTMDVSGVSYSPDGMHVASCSEDGSIRTFDTRTGEFVQESPAGNAGILCLSYSPDGRQIVSGDEWGCLRFWDASTMNNLKVWRGHTDEINVVAYSPNGQRIMSCSNDKSVILWDAQTGVLASRFTGHSGEVLQAAFSPDGSTIASASFDKTVRLWNVSSIGPNVDSKDTSGPLHCVAYSSDGRFVVSGALDGRVRRYDAETGSLDLVVLGEDGVTNCIAYSSNRTKIVTGTHYGDVILWTLGADPVKLALPGHESAVWVLAFSPCETWIASGSEDSTVRLWDAQTGQPGHVLSGIASYVQGIAFSPSGLELAVGDGHGEISTWDVGTGALKATMRSGVDGECEVVYLSGGMDQIFVGHERGELFIWDEDRESHRRVFTEGQSTTGRFSTSTKSFAMSTCSQWRAVNFYSSVRLYKRAVTGDQPEWKEVALIRNFLGRVNGIAWRPNELELTTVCLGGTVRAWRIVKNESGDESVRMVWHGGSNTLVSSDVVLANVVDLSTTNRKLLEQRN